jgi:uncharacterized membrane-anchored protein
VLAERGLGVSSIFFHVDIRYAEIGLVRAFIDIEYDRLLAVLGIPVCESLPFARIGRRTYRYGFLIVADRLLCTVSVSPSKDAR